MNLINKSLDEVKFNIPREILDRTFLDPRLVQRGVPVSIDARIRSEVIDKRVMTDCNLFGGMQAVIPLAGIIPTMVDPFKAIYVIPKSRTQGRTITSAFSVSYSEGAHGLNASHYLGNSSALSNALHQVLDSNLPVPLTSNAYVQMIGENTVFIEGEVVLPRDIFLRCMVSHDSEMSSIKPASYHTFAQLVILATKAHIYHNNYIPMDMGYLHAGMNLGSFKETIDGYADANELYYTHLNEVWRKTAVLNDEQSWRRHLKMLVGGGR